MDYKKFLCEKALGEEVKHSFLDESVGGVRKRHMYISGPFLQAEDRNRNGRIYPRQIIEREVTGFRPLIESREALGELDHPEYAEIKPKESAIRITELAMDGNIAYGKALVLDTRNGKELQALLEGDVRMGVSSRGTGNLRENNIVADDYHLITIDAVYMPSAQVAYTDTMYESVQRNTEWVLNESLGLYVENADGTNNADRMVNGVQATSPEKVKKILKATEKFNKKVDSKGSKAIAEAFTEWIKTFK